ncbi:MAG TPA: WecB/TagA/CpsF family glycosyltransferase [Polyangiaceae bacterium]|nr:WecB/TagA/CpsF family glycosyltransferase [Polyangiaceae bacterium]
MLTLPPRVRALGTRVDALTLREATEIVVSWVVEPSNTCRYVVTPNLDHAVLLAERVDFREAYDGAALVLADGTPLLWAARLNGAKLPQRVAGSDLGPAVLADLPAGTPVFLLGGAEEASRLAAAQITARWPQVKVCGRSSPAPGFEQDAEVCREICRQIRESGAKLLIVGLGAPKQELWVHRHRAELPGMTVLCLGATIDFIAGTKRRAPPWMQATGLEWLHRAGSEPRRLAARYMRDAVKLPGLLWRDRVERARG